MPKSKMASSTPRLSEYARSFVFPVGITKTVWPRVEAKGRELGLGFDWWQAQLGTVCLGYDKHGKYVSTVGGIGLSIPRQVGKTYFVLALLVIMCVLFPGLQVVWTAHHLRTSTKTFTALRGICRRKKLAPLIKSMRSANGEQQVEFVNGSMIMFGARSQGFGRGFDEIDVEVFDEAQILDTRALEDMIAATNQARHEHGALLFFMGTPPRPSDPSDAFTARRQKALDGKSKNAIWLEIGADPKSSPDDKSQFPLMNPSYPSRTPPEAMERLRDNLTDEDSWNREGRGIWDEAGSAKSKIPASKWIDNRCPVGTPIDSPVVVVDFRTGLEQSFAIAVAGSTIVPYLAKSVVDIAAYEVGTGKQWPLQLIVDEVLAVTSSLGLSSVAVDKYGDGNGGLIPLLIEAGLDVQELSLTDMRNGAVGFTSANINGEVLHVHDPQFTALDVAVTGAGTRKSTEGFLWSQENSSMDITTLRAVTAAWWVHHSVGSYDPMSNIF